MVKSIVSAIHISRWGSKLAIFSIQKLRRTTVF